MKRLIDLAVSQPITVTVVVILAVMAGLMALTSVAIRMTPEVDSVVIAVTTTWENASPEEVESDVIDQQEQRLGDISGLAAMTSISQAGRGQIRLEFRTGTDIGAAMAEVDQKLSEVPGYPDGVDEPEVEDVDPESVDYIAWIGLASTDPNFDPSELYDFMDRRLRPRLERTPGVSQVGIRGAREAEAHIRVDPLALAQRGITWAQLVDALDLSNDNYSGGKLPEGKSDIRVRAVGRFFDTELVRNLVIRRDESGIVYLRDVAEVVETHKEVTEWVRARGHRMPFFNFQLESGGNLLETMGQIQAEVDALNAPGGLLDQKAEQLGLNGKLELVQTYDSTTYVNDAIDLVRNNIFIGGSLAILTLLLFLRSLRTIGIIAIAIPISVIASMVILVSLGRSINIISLAGIAFATGMVVDNAIVVIENIFRHMEMGKAVKRAVLDGTKEVAGAVVASTATTLVVFFPILLIQESAGQLFRDIALAIMAAVGLSLIVSVTVIPTASAQLLKPLTPKEPKKPLPTTSKRTSKLRSFFSPIASTLADFPQAVGQFVYRINSRWSTRLTAIGTFAVVTLVGIYLLVPPMDYLPRGNRNIVFGILIPPPDYNVDQLSKIGERMEERVRPAWEVAGTRFGVEDVLKQGNETTDRRQPLPIAPGSDQTVTPPALDHYFLVAWDGRVFQVAISDDKRKTVDALPLMDHAVAGEAAPDVIAFSFQFPLFRTGGTTGSAIKIDLTGENLDQVSSSAGALMGQLIQNFGPYSVTPEPANFLLPTPEIRVVPDDTRLQEMGMARRDVGLAVQANGDGIFLPRQYQLGGELKDLKIISRNALEEMPIDAMLASPIATPGGQVVDLRSVAEVHRIVEPNQIKHVDRQRAVTLQFTPPVGLPLQQAIDQVNAMTEDLRSTGAIAQGIEINMAGSAGQLKETQAALLGDGTPFGFVTSSLFLAFMIIYLVMVVLFQSWVYPLVIMISVPLATFGGFIGLFLVHEWSVADRYTPIQNLDVLTILGFVILAGVVVNNAILLVEQTLNFLRQDESLTPREAIRASVASRVRPILMSTMTSVGGMLPLVLMPGSGSELYRGLGAVVVGGLLVSTVFTLVLVPVVLSVVFDLRRGVGNSQSETPTHHELVTEPTI